MNETGKDVAQLPDAFMASAEEIASAVLRRIGFELGDLSLRDVITHAVHEGIQFGVGIANISDEEGDEFASYSDRDDLLIDEVLPDDGVVVDRTVVSIERGRVIKREKDSRR